jgi:UDP-glucuronate 4-epimerase
MKTILITGCSGFIGYHLTKRLLNNYNIIGIDNLNDYYDIDLKQDRLKELKHKNFKFIKCDISNREELDEIFNENKIDKVINLAAYAGVRYSIENPDVYINSNIIGFYNILENIKKHKINHLIYASSSSVYGNNELPFKESNSTDNPISLYAATKKTNEILAQTYSNLYNIKCTGLRFFTVYGPFGRPDMAYYTFTKKIINKEKIQIFNNGESLRDFTYIDDIVEGIIKVLDKPITKIYNIGNSNPIKLLDFVTILKQTLINNNLIEDYELNIELLPKQLGDVDNTYADIKEIEKDFNYKSSTNIKDGLDRFVKWYKEYYEDDKKMIKNICIISKEYPSEKRTIYTFLEQLVNKFADYDINCYVISPQSVTQAIIRKKGLNKKKYYRYSEEKKKVTVYSPYYISYSNLKKIANMHYINLFNFERSTKKIFKKLNKKIKFDIIYAHFIFPSAIVANKLGKKYNIPVFFAYGENNNYTIDYLGRKKTRELLKGINGVISVSQSNKERLIKNRIVPEKIIEVIPNGIDNTIFYKKNKKEMRKELGYSENDFIIAFIGRFIEIKGIDRLCKALRIINNSNIKAIFIGEGPIKPDYKNTLFEGALEHNVIPDYLSASDIFVLPTNAEGCCNAIIESLACGLPVISSNKSFNDEILDDTCSIRINEMNVDEIKNAIEELYNDKKKREQFSVAALKKSEQLNLDNRAKKILDFMENKINN